MTPDQPRSAAPESPYLPVGELLAAYRARNPGKTALVDVDHDKAISFAQLAAAVEGIAIQLAELGIRKGSRVVLHADNSIEKTVLWLGIWRLAAVVCPIDLVFFSAAAAPTLQAIRPDLVISNGSEQTAGALNGTDARVVHYSAWQEVIADSSAIDGRLVVTPDGYDGRQAPQPSAAIGDIAAMTCTSGTTGLPKIVVYDHLSYWENGLAAIDLLKLTQQDRTLEYRSFDWYSAQILSLMPFLQTGLTMHLARRFSYSRLPDWIERYCVTVCAGVPTVINILLNKPVADAAARFSSLRAITCSTAPLSITHWVQFEEKYKVPVLALYGTSETGWVCGNRYGARKVGTVGKPVKQLQLQILDEAGNPCAPGTEGQVVVSGDKLALGYLRPDGAIDAIRGKPLALRDIGLMDRAGYVRIAGRTDDLIIRGGVKISPSEIDEVMLAYPDVLEGAVVGVPDPIYGQEPVCFVVAKPARTLNEKSILEHCAKSLPREKMPKRAFVIASLPRSSRGKILRDRLRSYYHSILQT